MQPSSKLHKSENYRIRVVGHIMRRVKVDPRKPNLHVSNQGETITRTNFWVIVDIFSICYLNQTITMMDQLIIFTIKPTCAKVFITNDL
ncbi:hypothetical protein FRX31_012041 [Thalictrum thalictroides]|uniref:Uncharacterized protein n=1 Tax=Thalictrum thalictroides TaxID=46969 RepID=A0A7J6WQJ4_THATH|nr:hypothetical protein FRX31_012041 [Thalictrum thalictroides]